METEYCPGTGGFGRTEWTDDEGEWVTTCGACGHVVPVGDDGSVTAHHEDLPAEIIEEVLADLGRAVLGSE